MFEEKAVDVIWGLSKIAIRYEKDLMFSRKVKKLQKEICNNRSSTYDSLQKASKLKMCEVVDVCTLLESRGATRVVKSDSCEIFQIRVIDKLKFL